jgi:hypothetical protein
VSVHDAEPGDIYVDAEGKLWRVLWTCREPTVCLQAVENSALFSGSPPDSTRQGGISGQMWHGFKRIWRKAEETKP